MPYIIKDRPNIKIPLFKKWAQMTKDERNEYFRQYHAIYRKINRDRIRSYEETWRRRRGIKPQIISKICQLKKAKPNTQRRFKLSLEQKKLITQIKAQAAMDARLIVARQRAGK